MMVIKLLEILNDIELDQARWEDGEDVMLFNGEPIGMTIGRHRQIDRWWPALKIRLAELIAKELTNAKE
jgi:hypothetical protein